MDWRELLSIYPQQIFDDLWLFPKRGEGGDGNFHGNFVPQLVEYLVLRYTEPGDVVLDPFAGSGTTLDVCRRLSRLCAAYDLTPVRDDIIQGNARWSDYTACDLAILHPPYFNIIKFSEHPTDLSNAHNLENYLVRLRDVAQNIGRYVRQDGWLALVVGDYYRNGKLTLLSYKCCELFIDYGFTLKVDYIKDMQGNNQGNTQNLWNYRHFKNGTARFRHEHIFVFRK